MTTESPLFHCKTCNAIVGHGDIAQWAEISGYQWWMWQIEGVCGDCSQLEYEILEEEGVLHDGC